MDTTGKRSVESGEADFGPPLFRMASDDFETRSASTRVGKSNVGGSLISNISGNTTSRREIPSGGSRLPISIVLPASLELDENSECQFLSPTLSFTEDEHDLVSPLTPPPSGLWTDGSPSCDPKLFAGICLGDIGPPPVGTPKDSPTEVASSAKGHNVDDGGLRRNSESGSENEAVRPAAKYIVDADGTKWQVRGSLGRGGLPQGGEEEGVEAESKPTTPRHVDQFGFWVDGKEPEASKEDRLKQARDERHVRRWRNMIGVGGGGWKKYSKRHPKDVKRRIRKGIPDRLRGLVWQLVSGSRDLLLLNPGVYQQLVFYETSSSELDIIRDINRTFPSHVFFQQRHGPGQRSLYNVLKAYSVYDTAVGYTQGMGFLAGLLLLYMGEEDAFWLLVALLKGALHTPMEGLYQSGLPLVQQYLFQFDQLVHEVLPRLGAHFDREGITPSMYASQWFITVFSYSFPFPTALRIWDVFLYEGMKIVFRVGLALLKNCQEQLLELPFEGLVHALRNFSSTSLDPDVLLPMAFSIKVSKRLEELRRQYLGLQTPSPSKSSVPESPRSRSSGSGLTPLTSPVAVRGEARRPDARGAPSR